tara:strand:- start:585 stop:1205 length:621 start_codon:yes stop_codon:yes gene_type:complete
MIRINLLKNTAGASSMDVPVQEMEGISFSAEGDDSAAFTDPKDILVKVVLALIFPIMIYGVDIYFTKQKQAQLNQVNQEIQQVKNKIASFGSKADSVKRFKQEKEGLVNRINIIKKLLDERLTIIKRLDALHRVIPEKAWLKKFSIENGAFKLQGLATDDFIVSTTIQNLEQSIYFSGIRLESSGEARSSDGAVREFNIRGQVTKQ